MTPRSEVLVGYAMVPACVSASGVLASSFDPNAVAVDLGTPPSEEKKSGMDVVRW